MIIINIFGESVNSVDKNSECMCFSFIATLAMTVSIVLWIMSQSLPSYYVENFPIGYHSKMSMMLLPNMGLYFMFIIIADLEARGKKVKLEIIDTI